MLSRGMLWALAIGCAFVLSEPLQAQVAGLPPHLERTSMGGVIPAEGYVWVSREGNDVRVKWQPGRAHSKHSHVVAAETEGKWLPTSGYRWLNDVAGDFRVIATSNASNGTYGSNTSGTYRKPSKEQVANALAKVLFALAAHSGATNSKNNGTLVEEFLREGLLRGRDGLIESAVTDLFPGIRPIDARTLRRAICLSWDGKLNEQTWSQSTAREEMIAALKKYDPDLGMAADANDFVVNVMNRRNR